jgi:hypothetical protein
MMRAYIDIDGVLIRNGRRGPRLIPKFPRVIRYLKKNFDCYWLTTHVRSGVGSAGALNKLAPYLKKARIDPGILEGINPTDWHTLKTEAIDFTEPFIWLEDSPLIAERRICEEKGCLDSIVLVDWEKRASRLTVRCLRRVRRKALL